MGSLPGIDLTEEPIPAVPAEPKERDIDKRWREFRAASDDLEAAQRRESNAKDELKRATRAEEAAQKKFASAKEALLKQIELESNY